MKFERAGGILLHPSSLPGSYGIGDLGPAAHAWIEFLHRSGCRLWQVLPLGPTGYGNSPYQCFSSFAGNPNLISLEELVRENLLQPEDLENRPVSYANRVDFGQVIPWKANLLIQAYQTFCESQPTALVQDYRQFKKENEAWLEDYSLFMALKEKFNGSAWTDWDPALRDHKPGALRAARLELSNQIERQIFVQFVFFHQWQAVRQHACQMNIQIIGDVPIFTAQDSCDVWAHRDLFQLNPVGKPTVVAGVPPDYFSSTGQLWGNPLYDWPAHQTQGFNWWLARIKSALKLVDLIRLDHFRGFLVVWEIPASASTAEKGRWVKAPGRLLFNLVQRDLDGPDGLPFIAEDLGVITPDVIALQKAFHLPGMKVLQFAFDDQNPENPFLPHNFSENCVVYTGTHDNATTQGWYANLPEQTHAYLGDYLGRQPASPAWELIRLAWASVATFAIAPMQDFLELDDQARMNYPGSLGGNWEWRMEKDELTEEMEVRICQFNTIFGRNLS